MADSKSKQEEGNIPVGEDIDKKDDSGSEKTGNCTGDGTGTGSNGNSKQDNTETGNKGSDKQVDTETESNGSGKKEGAGTGSNGSGEQVVVGTGSNGSDTEDDAGTEDDEPIPKDDRMTVDGEDQVTDDQCQVGSPSGQTASGPTSVEGEIENRSNQEKGNIVLAGEDSYKNDSGQEEKGNCTGDDTVTERNGSDKQIEAVTQDKELSPKDDSVTVDSEDQVTDEQCQVGSPSGQTASGPTSVEEAIANRRQHNACKLKLKEKEDDITTLEEKLRKTKEEHASVLKDKETEFNSLKTKMSREKEEHASVLKEKEDKIHSLETDMGRQKKEHDSILKQREDEIESLGTKIKSELSSYVSALQRHADEEATLDSKMNDLNNFIKEQGSSIATLNDQLSEKAKIIQHNGKRIRELEIESNRFKTAADATKSNSVSRIASMKLEQAKELERARQDYWRKWKEMEITHRQDLKEREANATELIEECQRETDTQRKETKAVEEKCKKEEDKLKKEVDEMKKKVESISKKKSDLESDLQQRKETNRELERKNTGYSNSLRIAGETNRNLSEQIEGQIKIYNAMAESYNLFQSDANKIQQAKDSLEKYLQQREGMYRQEIANLNAEIRRLTLRLSKIASAKMTTGNSSIADLSDVFRPTKISELFSELYDNQWTDAFDQLTKESDREERDAILVLLEILQESYKTCVSTAQSHLQGVKDAMCNFRIHATQEPVSQENGVTKVDLEVPDESWKMIMDFHKAAAYGSKGEIAMNISSSQMENREFRNMDKVGDYMKTCAEICWLMAVQDPPVVVDVLDVPPGCQKPFSKDRYRAYTRTGKFYDFTVWPALLLQKDGPILCKGVAQGK